jgi:hypothetical protein
MKYAVALLWLAIATFSSCNDPDTLSEEEKVKILLIKPWEVAYVQLESTDVTDLGYSLMQIEFLEDGTWTATQTNSLFGASGTWQLAPIESAVALNSFQLSGKEVLFRLSPDGASLTFYFEREGSETIGGRTRNTGGSYEIYWLPKFVPPTP